MCNYKQGMLAHTHKGGLGALTSLINHTSELGKLGTTLNDENGAKAKGKWKTCTQ